jgi:hypothetical protein
VPRFRLEPLQPIREVENLSQGSVRLPGERGSILHFVNWYDDTLLSAMR